MIVAQFYLYRSQYLSRQNIKCLSCNVMVISYMFAYFQYIHFNRELSKGNCSRSYSGYNYFLNIFIAFTAIMHSYVF